jgi:hypothetical protein
MFLHNLLNVLVQIAKNGNISKLRHTHALVGSDLKERNYTSFCIQNFPHGLSPTASTGYSLWKTTKKLKTVTQHSTPIRTSQGTWVRSNAEKAQAFAHHLAPVFQPHPSDPN